MDYKHTISMVLEHLFCSFIFLPIHHLSTHIFTRPQRFLPIQMTGGRVCIKQWVGIGHYWPNQRSCYMLLLAMVSPAMDGVRYRCCLRE